MMQVDSKARSRLEPKLSMPSDVSPRFRRLNFLELGSDIEFIFEYFYKAFYRTENI